MKQIFYYLIFPGCAFTVVVGCLASWIDRKVTARVQFRKGPPFLQPFWDIMKLLGKETTIPRGSSRWAFLLSPIIAFSSTILVSTILWRILIAPKTSYIGDLIVVIYLLTIPSICLVVGGAASSNPLSSLGASREMKMILSYELPFILALFVPVIKSGGHLDLGYLVDYQWMQENHVFVLSASGFLAFLVAIISMQAKLGLVPFDNPEAETEIIAGPYTEYSGPPLALFKLTGWMSLFVLPVFLMVIYMGGIRFQGIHILWGILKYVLLLVIIVLIRNTNPRVRIDQAMRFFWGKVLIIAVIAVILAFLGV
jgi:NADH-quinone oxidoreductase subunit H